MARCLCIVFYCNICLLSYRVHRFPEVVYRAIAIINKTYQIPCIQHTHTLTDHMLKSSSLKSHAFRH